MGGEENIPRCICGCGLAMTWASSSSLDSQSTRGSKVYLARVQREAHKKLNPYRSDERRNLLCDREQGNPMEPTTSRNTSSGQVSRWASFRVRTWVNTYQTLVFMVHNVVGYLLMLAVMVYNVHLLLAVVFGMMLGYFLFGTKLTRLQMQCFGTKRVVICTPECDDTDRCNTEKCSWEVCEGKLCKQLDALELQQADTALADVYPHKKLAYNIIYNTNSKLIFPADTTTPPLLDSTGSSDSDTFVCQTRTCIQPSHYFRASTSQDGEPSSATCYYGAKKCPSKVARAKKQANTHCQHSESEKEDSPCVEDTQLLQKHSCCTKPQTEKCCKSSQISTIVVHETDKDSESQESQNRENSPQISCCHAKAASSDSQEQIVT
ncbi:unnamed protein product, partial [Brenthis ino]